MKNIKIYFWSLALLFLGAGSVVLAIEVSTSASEIVKLEEDTKSLSIRQKELSRQLIKSASLNSIEDKAEKLEFGKPENIVYLGGGKPVAKLP